MGRKRSRPGEHLYFLIACVLWISAGIPGCGPLQVIPARLQYWQADEQTAAGNYQAAIQEYQQIVKKYPKSADRALFCMGYIYAHPKNPDRDYEKALDVFKRLVSAYPQSDYRPPSESFIPVLIEVTNRDRRSAGLRKQVDTLEKQVKSLENQIEAMKAIDRNLEEKRRQSPRK
ncbi:MAG TPA: tetratricopeptide repeat protein [Syntrophales bacterium]|jgi:outer membrane protein assembly factor BamD (BamD/ComL family)|nr:tetratricopeptide repeat protein [Syntrophales bacterium]